MPTMENLITRHIQEFLFCVGFVSFALPFVIPKTFGNGPEERKD